MKDLNDIRKDSRIVCAYRDIEDDTKIQLKLDVLTRTDNKKALVKFTRFLGWEHLSVFYEDETPSWDLMQEMKEMFWKDDEVCMQLHPKKEDYINNHEHCLHIWRPTEITIPVPPTIFIGFRPGKEAEDRVALKKMQEDLGNPLSDEDIDLMVMASLNKKALEDKISKMSINELMGLLKFL